MPQLTQARAEMSRRLEDLLALRPETFGAVDARGPDGLARYEALARIARHEFPPEPDASCPVLLARRSVPAPAVETLLREHEETRNIHRDYEAALDAARRRDASVEDLARLQNVATFLSGFLITHQRRVLAVIRAGDLHEKTR